MKNLTPDLHAHVMMYLFLLDLENFIGTWLDLETVSRIHLQLGRDRTLVSWNNFTTTGKI